MILINHRTQSPKLPQPESHAEHTDFTTISNGIHVGANTQRGVNSSEVFIFSHYQVNTCINNTSWLMIKFRILWEGAHERLFQGSQLPVSMCFQEHGTSSARRSLIVISDNWRHNIFWGGVSIRYCLLNPWTCIIQWSSVTQLGWCWFISVL